MKTPSAGEREESFLPLCATCHLIIRTDTNPHLFELAVR